MDQSASVAGGFLLYDGSDVTFEKLEPDLGENIFAVADSGVSRSLAQSSYPIRVAESREALAIANRELGWKYSTLAEISGSDLDLLAEKVPDELSETLYRRVRHVVTECGRVADGYGALKSANWARFGNLMTASGQSSANDYEISHSRVEELVTIALAVPEVVGARMMGGGEGGTALILAHQSAIPALKRRLAERYYAKYGLETGVHIFQSAPGAEAFELHSSNIESS
jgi:galactokinase